MGTHLHGEERQGEDGGDGEVALEPGEFRVLRCLMRVSIDMVEAARFIARLADGGLDGGERRSGDQLHHGAFGGEVDGSGDDTGHAVDGFLHAPDAGGAGHAVDAEIDGLACHVISSLPDGGDDRLGCRRLREAHVGALRGEIDGCTRDARHGGNRLLHAPHTGGAGHALDGEALERQRRKLVQDAGPWW